MVDLKINLCDIRHSHQLNATGGGMCMEGRQSFMDDVKPLIEIRHEIGAARLEENNASRVNRLKRRLARKGKIIEKRISLEYQRSIPKCKDSDVTSCGYIVARDSYIELFGPLESFGRADRQRHTMQLKPFNQDFLFTQGFDGATSEVLFDTGTESTVFSPTFIGRNPKSLNKLFELPSQGAIFYENTGLEFSLLGMFYDPVFIGTAVMVDNFGAAEDGRALNALIGVDYILRGSFAVDYDERTLTIGHDVDEMLKGDGWGWMPFNTLPTDLNNYQISVLIYFNGHPLPVILDSGSSTTNISQSCLKDEPLTKGDYALSFYGIHGSMRTEDEVNLKIGNCEYSSQMTVLPTDHPMSQMYLEDQLCGNIGLDELGKFDYIIDPDAHGIYLKLRNNFSNSPIFYFGIISEKTKQGALIRRVEEGSAAELAGIRPGDLITEIDGRDITKMSPIALSDLQWTEKDEIAVDILREGSMRCLVMKRPEE